MHLFVVLLVNIYVCVGMRADLCSRNTWDIVGGDSYTFGQHNCIELEKGTKNKGKIYYGSNDTSLTDYILYGELSFLYCNAWKKSSLSFIVRNMIPSSELDTNPDYLGSMYASDDTTKSNPRYTLIKISIKWRNGFPASFYVDTGSIYDSFTGGANNVKRKYIDYKNSNNNKNETLTFSDIKSKVFPLRWFPNSYEFKVSVNKNRFHFYMKKKGVAHFGKALVSTKIDSTPYGGFGILQTGCDAIIHKLHVKNIMNGPICELFDVDWFLDTCSNHHYQLKTNLKTNKNEGILLESRVDNLDDTIANDTTTIDSKLDDVELHVDLVRNATLKSFDSLHDALLNLASFSSKTVPIFNDNGDIIGETHLLFTTLNTQWLIILSLFMNIIFITKRIIDCFVVPYIKIISNK